MVAPIDMVFVSVLNNVFNKVQLNHTLFVFLKHRKDHEGEQMTVAYARSHVDVLGCQTSEPDGLQVLGPVLISA